MKNLLEFSSLKLFEDEKVLEVQRQHWIVLIIPVLMHIVIILGVCILVGVFLLNKEILPFHIVPAILLDIVLLILSVIFVMVTFVFMNWYYQFYIVTSKRLVHIHQFRLGGYHFEEVFLKTLSQKEIIKKASNFIYDLLGIENITIYFQNIERQEPFEFVTPQNSEKLEDILENLLEKGEKQK